MPGADLCKGASGQCATFESPCLASADMFHCVHLEVRSPPPLPFLCLAPLSLALAFALSPVIVLSKLADTRARASPLIAAVLLLAP